MNAVTPATTILCVDDDPGIRLTLPQILSKHGFQVTSTATVAEALSQIASNKFDVLISDLNIGEPGDGFTVVSAMRRTQPDCLTFILTGYPAFETALQAIRSHVDEYLLKPAPIPELVRAIQYKLGVDRKTRQVAASKRISDIMKENAADIVKRALTAIKAEPELAALPLTDDQRVYLYELLEPPSTSLESKATRSRR